MEANPTTLPPGPLEPEDLDTTEGARTLPQELCAHRMFYTAPDGQRCCACDGLASVIQANQEAFKRKGMTVFKDGVLTESREVGEVLQRANLQEIRHDVTDMRARFEQFVADVHRLNTAVGEFKKDLVIPMMEEFKGLRYTLSDSAGSSVSQLHALARAFDKRLNLVLTVIGKTPAEIAKIREAAGIAPDMPSLAELEAEGAPAVTFESAVAANAALQKQNSRLIAEVEVLRKQRDRARSLVRKKRRRS